MLIRARRERVFDAFVNPELTTKFWFSKSSGRLQPGAKVVWEWETFNLSAPVTVLEFTENERLVFEWGDPAEKVEWDFIPREADQTLVKIKTYATGSEDQRTATAVDLKGGFTMVLAGAKALLEQGVTLNLITDQFPDDCPYHSDEAN